MSAPAWRTDTDESTWRPADVVCPACAGTNTRWHETISLSEQHAAYAKGDAALLGQLETLLGTSIDSFYMRRCHNCGLEFATPAMTPSPDWYGALYSSPDLYPAERWEYGVVREQIDADDAVVDYGCGTGEFLASLAGRARTCIGFDFLAASVEHARQRGIEAHLLDLRRENDHSERRPATARHIVAFHVLEHLARPADLFDFAGRVAAREARLWVAVPSDRRASRVYGEQDSLDAPPHHLSRWTEAALDRLGERQGWVLREHRYEPLPTRLAIWEATRRTTVYAALNPSSHLLRRTVRRGIAALVWASGQHRRAQASGFSMLACFTRKDAP